MFDTMFDTKIYSLKAKEVMQLAKEEARRLNHEYIGTEHILLGLIRQQKGKAYRILSKLGVDFYIIDLKVKKLIAPGKEPVIQEKFPLTPRAKRAIEYAVKKARSLNCPLVKPEHLLIGLLSEEESIACQILDGCRVNLEQVLHGCGVKSEDVRTEVKKLSTARGKKTASKTSNKKKEKPVKCKIFLIKSIPAEEIIGEDLTDSGKTQEIINNFLAGKKFISAGQSSVIFKTESHDKEFICTVVTIYYREV